MESEYDNILKAMPTCRQCQSKFPNSALVNGKRKNLQRRRYCLTCSPFGQHKGKLLDKGVNNHECVCSSCGQSYHYQRGKGSSLKQCSGCRSNERARRIKLKAIAYKGGKCQLCEYDRCPGAMTFHHRDPSEKDFAISANHCRNWQSIQIELDKCDLLCVRCHAEVHADMHRGRMASQADL